MKYLVISGVLAAAGMAAAAAAATGAHVHGLARLTVTIDHATLTITLESPLDNLLGFEHEPRTPEQHAALAGMVATLQSPARMFTPTAAADCAPADAVLESPLLASGHDHDHHHHHHHADLHAEYIFDCTAPDKLRGIDVELFTHFPRLERIDAEIAVPGLQTAERLDAGNTKLRWR